MNNKKSISIVIPNYNGKNLLETYLPFTLIAIESEDVVFEIIVVDDASEDDSVAFLKENYPGIMVVENIENRGFSFSCNVGLKHAHYDLVLFLNSDIKLTPDYFSRQWHYFEDPQTFGVMGKILVSDGKKIEVAARFPSLLGFKLKTNRLFYFKKNLGKATPTLFLSGANALIDASKIRELGGFDEIYSPYYAEDLDLGIRAWRVGWKSHYDHHSTCFHLGSHTTKNHCDKSWVKQIYFRNRIIFHAIHTESKSLPFWKIQLFLMEILPKVLIGQVWILKSYLAYRKQKIRIETSRKSLEEVMKVHKSQKSISDLKQDFTKISEDKNLVWV